MLCLCSQLPATGLTGQDLWASPGICLHISPPVSGPFLQLGSSPYSFQDCFFFPTLLLSRKPSFRCQALRFPNLNSVYAEAQHMITLLTAGSTSCSFINWWFQDVPLFCLFQVLSKFICSLYWLQPGCSGLLLKGSTVQFQSFIHTHTNIICYLLAFAM